MGNQAQDLIEIQNTKKNDLKMLKDSLGQSIEKHQTAMRPKIEEFKKERDQDFLRVQKALEEKDRLKREHEERIRKLRL